MHKMMVRVFEHRLFRLGVFVKGAYGLLELFAGMILFILDSREIVRIVQRIFGHELLQDPKDWLGNLFMNAARNLSVRMHVFISLYIIVHGLVNIGIALALIYRKLWAYPLVGVLMALFIIYQIYQIIYTHSILMILLTLADIVILALLKFEYDRNKRSISN